MEDSRQSREHGVSLLLHRRKITANTAKSGGASRTAKGARNLLLHFRPAKIPLSLIVGKRNAQVVEQSQDLLSTRHERIQQILGLALLGSAFARSGGRGGWWLSSIARRQNLKTASDPVVALAGGNSGQVEQTPLLAGVLQVAQEVVHLGGPLLLLLLELRFVERLAIQAGIFNRDGRFGGEGPERGLSGVRSQGSSFPTIEIQPSNGLGARPLVGTFFSKTSRKS